jgi:hypothetical protein
MLIAGLMALHAAGFAAWLAAGCAAALLDEAGAGPRAQALARRWAPAAMAVCLASGGLSWFLAYPLYREQGWVWAKVLLTLVPMTATALQAAGRLRPKRALWLLSLPMAGVLLLSFARPF